MREYMVFTTFAQEGRLRSLDVICPDDGLAMRLAEDLASNGGADVWEGQRFVGLIPRRLGPA